MSDPPASDPGSVTVTHLDPAWTVNLQTFVAQLAVRVAACEARLTALQAAEDAWAAETAAANAIRSGGLAPPGARQDSADSIIVHDMPPTAPR
jgi:hypothetical protein